MTCFTAFYESFIFYEKRWIIYSRLNVCIKYFIAVKHLALISNISKSIPKNAD